MSSAWASAEYREQIRKTLPPARHFLVRRTKHGEALYTGRHCSHIEGMGAKEGRELVRELTQHVVQPRFVYRHVWQEGDLVIYDNRSVLHRGRPWDPRYPRLFSRATVSERGNDVVEAGRMPSAEAESAPFPSQEEAVAWHVACGANDFQDSPYVFFAPAPTLGSESVGELPRWVPGARNA